MRRPSAIQTARALAAAIAAFAGIACSTLAAHAGPEPRDGRRIQPAADTPSVVHPIAHGNFARHARPSISCAGRTRAAVTAAMPEMSAEEIDVVVDSQLGAVVVTVPSEPLATLGEFAYDELLRALNATVDAGCGAIGRVSVRGGSAATPLEPESEHIARATDGDKALPHADGALAGRRVAISPGHGWYWTGSRWATQRGDNFGIIEDFLTSEIARFHLSPYIEGLGAEQVWLREPDGGSAEPSTVDDGDVGYRETGEFADGTSSGGFGGDYRAGPAGAEPSPEAVFSVERAQMWLPAYVWWVPGANRATAVDVVVEAAGERWTRTINQTRGGPGWQWIGRFPLGEAGTVSLRTAPQEGRFLISDALRIGSFTGSIVRSGETTGRPGWQECSRNYAEFSGAPASAYAARSSERDSDVVARPLWANLLDVDAYVSIHSNGGGGTGTETFIHDSAPTPGSAELQDVLHARLVSDIRAHWNADWVDRGEKRANFGELRALSRAPGVLVEVAFHDRNPDTGPDNPSLHDPEFRRIVGRALARGLVDHFSPDAPYVPQPPRRVRLTAAGGGLRASWSASPTDEGGGAATQYRIYVARNGRVFDDGTDVDGRSFDIAELGAGDVVSVRVAGRNAGGLGVPSHAVTARYVGGAPRVLLVHGFDRWDRYVDEIANTFDFGVDHGTGLAVAEPEGTVGFDGATNEVISEDLLAGYDAVVFALGEESTQDETFSATERAAVRGYLDGGGAIIASGAEIGWHLVERGDADERAFFGDVFAAEFVSDDAETHVVAGVEDGPLGVIASFSLHDGTTGRYDVDFPDVLGAGADGRVALRYEGGGAAAIAAVGERPAVLFGFPLESVIDDATRGTLLLRALEHVGYEPPGLDPGDAGGAGDVGGPDAGRDMDAGMADALDAAEPTDGDALDVASDGSNDSSDAPPADVGVSADAATPEDAGTVVPRDTGRDRERELGGGGGSIGQTEVRVNNAFGCAVAGAARADRHGTPLGWLTLGAVGALVARRRGRNA